MSTARVAPEEPAGAAPPADGVGLAVLLALPPAGCVSEGVGLAVPTDRVEDGVGVVEPLAA